MEEFVNPNLHVALVHAPMGLLLIGTLVELFAFLGWRRDGFRAAGRWMILLGTLTAVPTALSGIYGLNDVMRDHLPAEMEMSPWKDVLQHSPHVTRDGGKAWEHMRDHAYIQSVAVGVLLLVVLIWLSASEVWRVRLHVPLTLLLLTAVGGTMWGAWESGEGIYTQGVGVTLADESSALHESTAPESTTSPGVATPQAAMKAEASRQWPRDPAFYIPPVEGHTIMAGLTISLAVVALGLAIHNATAPLPEVDGMDDIAAALGPAGVSGSDPYIHSEQRSLLERDRVIQSLRHHTLPSARFWLLAALVGLLTMGGGIWILSRPENFGTWNLKTLAENVFDANRDGKFEVNRRSAHAVIGVSIVAIALLLALFGRFAPRQRFIVFTLGLLLLAAVAGQIWLGTLMTLDTAGGPISGFN